MDFQNLKRKELQALCKKHNIPANLSNLTMANRLTAIFKPQEIEKPSAQDLDEIETETDSNNVLSDRKFKKVRFSPDNEVFEFTKSAGNKSRKNSRLVVGGGRVTRSRGQDLVEVSVKEKKRGKNAVISNSDTHSLVTIENCDNRAVTRRSTRHSGVVDRGNITAGLGMNTREEVWKESKISEDAVIVNKPQILLGSSRLKPYDNYVKRDKVMDQDAIADAKAFVEPHIRVRRSTRNLNNNCEGRDEVTVDKKIIEGKVIVEPQRRSKRKDNYHCEESDEVLKKKELAEEKVTIEPQILPRRSKRKGINNHEGSHEADFCEEVVKDKKTAVAKVIAEPRIILRRPKRKVNMIDDSEMLIGDAKKQEHVESRGLRKTSKSMSFKGSGVDSKDTENTAKNEGKIEVITHIQESMKVELQRNRRTSVMPGNESLGNDDTNKLSSSVMQEDSTRGVSKGEKVCQPGGVLRRSGRNTLKLEIVSVTENLDTDEAIQKIVKKDTSAVQRSIGTSHRKASKYTSPKISAEFAGDAINQLENEEMNIEKNACFRKEVLNDDSDPLFMSKSSRMESKVQGKKLSCNLSGSSLLEASSQESLMANEESLSAQLTVTALSMSSTKTNKDKRLTSSTESARNIQDSSIADGVRNADTESINGIPLANFDETETFRTSELLINSTNCDAISDRVVDNVQLSLDADVQKLVEQTNCVTQNNEVAAPVLCQIEDLSCHNITNNNELPLAFNVSEKVGIAGTSSIADILTNCDQTDFEADMKVTKGEVEKCAQLCLDFVNLVSQVKGVSFQENVVPIEQQCINELALPIQCHLGDLDIPEASKESSEKNDENCAPEAGEVSASKPSGSVVSAFKEAGVAETTEKTEAEDVQSKISCDNMSLDKTFSDDVDIFRKSEEGLYKITDEPDEQPKTPFDIAKNFPLMESYSHGSKTRNSLSISKTTHQSVKKFIPDGNEPIKIEISSKVDEFSVLEQDLDSREGVSKMKEVEIQNQSLEKVGEAGNELVNASPGNSILPKFEGAIGEDLNLAINVELKKVNANLNLPVAMDAPIEVYEEKFAGMLCSRLIETSLMNSQGQSILDEEADDIDTEVRCHDKSLDTDWSKITDENSGHVKIGGKIAQTNEVEFCVSATGIGMCPIPTNSEDSNSERETFNEAFGGHPNDEVAKADSIGSEIDVVMMDKDESTEKKYVQTADAAGSMNDTICNVESEKPIEPKLLDIEEIKNPCQKHIMCDEGEQLSDEESGQSLQVNVFGNLFLTPEQNINSSGLSEASSRVAKIPSLVTSFDEQDCSLTEKKEETNGVSGSERKFESTYCGKVEGKIEQTNEAAFCVSATGIGMCPVPTNFDDSNSVRETFKKAFGGHLNDEVAKAGSIGSEIDVVMMDKDESTEMKYVQTADAAGSMNETICNVESEIPIEPKLLDIEEIENPCQKHIMCDEGKQLSDEESGQTLQENVFGNLFGTPEQNINSSGPSEASSCVAKIPSLVTSFNEQDCSLTEKKDESTYCGKVEGKIVQTNEAACCLSATGGIGMCPVPTSFEDSNTVRETFNEAFGEVAKAGSIGSEIDVEMVDKDESTEKKYVQTADAAGSMNDTICNVESEKPIEPKLLDIDEIKNPCQKHIMCDEGEQLSDEESGQSLQENVFGNLFRTPEQNINSSGPSEASSRVAKIPSLVTSFNEQDYSLTEKKDEPDGVSGYERKFESTYCIESVPSMMKDALIQSICHEEVGEAGNELVNKHTVSLPISVLTDRKGPSEEEINLVKNVEVVNFSTCSFALMDKYVPTEDQSMCAEMACDRMKGTSSLSEQTMYSQGQSIIDEEAKDSDIEVRCHDKSLDTDLSENLKEGDIAQTNEVPICISATGIGMCPFPTKCEDNNSLRETFNDAFGGPPFQEVATVGSIGSKIDVVMMEKDETTEKKYAQTADAAGSMYDAIRNVGSERPVEPKLVGMEEIANPCQELLECNITCDEGEQLSDEESGQSLQENEFGNLFETPEQKINSSGPSEAYSCVAKIPSLVTSFDEQDCSLTEKKHEIDGVSGSEFKMESTNCTERVPSIKIDTLIQPICHEDVGDADNELVNSYTVSPAISVLADRESPSVEDVKDVEVVNLNTSPIFQVAKHFPTEASQEKCSEMTCDQMKRSSCISEKNDLHLWNTIFAEDATVSDSEIIDKVGGADLLKLATTEKNNCFAANCEDNITVRESFVDAFEEPLNSEVGRTGCIEGEILIMDKGKLCSPFTEEITCEMKSNDGNSYDTNCLDHIDDIPRFSHEMNDELHINIQADVMSYSEADILASNSEKQSTVKESKETHVTFQNAAEDRSTFLHVEPELFTGLEMQLLKGEHDITDTGNSEAEPSTFCLEGDHVKHCRDGESNSAKRLVLHLQEKVEDFSNDSLPVSDLPSSQCDEILKESDVLDTIKEYINSEFSLSADFHDSGCANLPFDISTHMEEGNNNDNAASSKTRETESCVASISIASGKEIDTEDSRLFSTAKKNARTILIHGTPGKSLKMADMKENAPKSKTSQRGDFTTVRPAKRKALQDIRWK